jgi:anti-anti-sigma factor
VNPPRHPPARLGTARLTLSERPQRRIVDWQGSMKDGSRDIVVEQVGAIRVVALIGEHDIGTLNRLQTTLREAVSAGPVLVDLSDCRFIDSSSLAVLFHASQQVPSARFAVVAPAGSEPARLLSLVAFGQVVPVYDTRDAALAAVSAA